MSKRIELENVEVERLTVSIDADELELSAEDAVAACVDDAETLFCAVLEAGDWEQSDLAPVLEAASAQALLEALHDKEPADLIAVLSEKNELEQAAKAFIESLNTEDLLSFLNTTRPTFARDLLHLSPRVEITFENVAPMVTVVKHGDRVVGSVMIERQAGSAWVRLYADDERRDTGMIKVSSASTAYRIVRAMVEAVAREDMEDATCAD